MDHLDRIDEIRHLLGELEIALSHFGRKAEPPARGASHAFGTKVAFPQVSKMIRYADDESFAKVVGKLADLRKAVNSLPADIDDSLDDVRDEGDDE